MMIWASASLRSEIWMTFCRGNHSKSLILSLKVLFERSVRQFLIRITRLEENVATKPVNLGRLSWFGHDNVFERFTVRIAIPTSGREWARPLNCPKDAKNGFFGKFYIDILIRKFSPLFFSVEKNIFSKWKNIFLKMPKFP